MPTIYPIVDEGLGNSAYVVELGDGRALVMDPARDPPRTCSSPWTKAPSMPIRCARCPHRDVAPIPNRSWMVPSVGPSPQRSRSPAGPVPRVLVGPRAVPARHRPAVRGAGRATPPPRPPGPSPARAPGRRHPLSSRPVRQRVQAPAQERRRHHASSPAQCVEAIGCRLPPGGDPSSLVFTGPGGGPGRAGGVGWAPGPCCRAATTAPTRPPWLHASGPHGRAAARGPRPRRSEPGRTCSAYRRITDTTGADGGATVQVALDELAGTGHRPTSGTIAVAGFPGRRPAAGGRGSARRPRLSPHLRDLAGGRRRPRAGHR